MFLNVCKWYVVLVLEGLCNYTSKLWVAFGYIEMQKWTDVHWKWDAELIINISNKELRSPIGTFTLQVRVLLHAHNFISM